MECSSFNCSYNVLLISIYIPAEGRRQVSNALLFRRPCVQISARREVLLKDLLQFTLGFPGNCQSSGTYYARTASCHIHVYVVCSKSIRIGIVAVVHWVGCVCNQSWHVRTSLSNSWLKLQVDAFAQLAVVGRGSNTCVYVIAIFTMCESTEQRICIKFCF